MLGLTIFLTMIVLMVLFVRPKDKRFNPRRSRQLKESLRQYTYSSDETAKEFAEQWEGHPTLTNRQAKAIKRGLREKKHRG
jgi:hypothetical protein